MKRLFYIKILCLLAISSFAQDLYIKGTVTDKKTSHPVKKVKLSLYNYKDSLVNETFSDKKGFYTLQAGGNDNYYMLVDEKKYSRKKIVFGATSKSIDNGNITLNKKVHPPYFSRKNTLGISLKVNDIKAVEKNGKTIWIVKTTLRNHSFRAFHYFGYSDCEPNNYSVMSMVDTIGLSIDYKNCNSPKETVIAVRPFRQHTVDLEIYTNNPAPPSFKFRVILFATPIQNLGEQQVPDTFLKRKLRSIVSKQIKT